MQKTLGSIAPLGRPARLGGKAPKLGDTIPPDLALNTVSSAGTTPLTVIDTTMGAEGQTGVSDYVISVAPTGGGDGGAGAAGDGGDGGAGAGAGDGGDGGSGDGAGDGGSGSGSGDGAGDGAGDGGGDGGGAE